MKLVWSRFTISNTIQNLLLVASTLQYKSVQTGKHLMSKIYMKPWSQKELYSSQFFICVPFCTLLLIVVNLWTISFQVRFKHNGIRWFAIAVINLEMIGFMSIYQRSRWVVPTTDYQVFWWFNREKRTMLFGTLVCSLAKNLCSSTTIDKNVHQKL